MLMSTDVVLLSPWCDHRSDANCGVKHGATESPVLFSKLLDDLLTSIKQEKQGMVLDQMSVDGACFMDDILSWKCPIEDLHAMMKALIPALAYYGLRVQPGKRK